MSHELRTPLNAMLGWATMLQKDNLDRAMIHRGLAVIERNTRTQARLVADLLDVSRIISGKLRLTIKKVDVSGVIYAAVDVVRQAAEAKGVRLIVSLEPDVGSLLADPDRLQQIAWNLLSNAVKFTPSGGAVTVTAQRANSCVRLSVKDTGLGIASEHLTFIFERFRQIDGSSTRAHAGLGLGLAIVRHLAEAHGGTVKAYSDGAGTGATFVVDLPLRAVHVADLDDAPLEKARSGVADRASIPQKDLGGMHILVVDDDADSLELLRIALENVGATTRSARSARQALNEAVNARFDIIISDIGMPEMDGLPLCGGCARSMRPCRPSP